MRPRSSYRRGRKLQEIKQQINDLVAMRSRLERIVKDWDARLARTSKGKPAGCWRICPQDVIGTPNRLTAKLKKRGRR